MKETLVDYIKENFSVFFNNFFEDCYKAEVEEVEASYGDDYINRYPHMNGLVSFVIDTLNQGELDSFADYLNENWDGENGCWFCGASKVVFVPKDGDCVVKVVINSDDSLSEWDIYNSAIDNGLEEYFAKTEEETCITCLVVDNDESCKKKLYDNYRFRFTVYEQEKIEDNRLSQRLKNKYYDDPRYIKNKTKEQKEILKTADKICDEPCVGNLIGSAFFYVATAIAPSPDLLKIIRFLANESVNDLHTGNFAIVKGKPIIYDFAGYGV